MITSRQVDDSILEGAAGCPVLGEKFRTWQEGGEDEGVVGGLHTGVHMYICKAEEHQVGNSITRHDGDICFVG